MGHYCKLCENMPRQVIFSAKNSCYLDIDAHSKDFPLNLSPDRTGVEFNYHVNFNRACDLKRIPESGNCDLEIRGASVKIKIPPELRDKFKLEKEN
jgi:hypothetical protein